MNSCLSKKHVRVGTVISVVGDNAGRHHASIIVVIRAVEDERGARLDLPDGKKALVSIFRWSEVSRKEKEGSGKPNGP